MTDEIGEEVAGATNQPKVRKFDIQALATTHATATAIWDKEADRFWVRSNLMLIVGGILLGASISQDIAPEVKVFASAFGLYFSWIWMLLNRKGAHYVARWRPMIVALEKSMLDTGAFPVLPLSSVQADKDQPKQPMTLAERANVLLGRAKPKIGAGGLLHYIIVGFLVTWAALLLFNAAVLVGVVEVDQGSSKQEETRDVSEQTVYPTEKLVDQADLAQDDQLKLSPPQAEQAGPCASQELDPNKLEQ